MSAKKKAAKKSSQKKGADPLTTGPRDTAVGKAAPKAAKKSTRTREKAVGLKHHPANKRIPGSALIPRAADAETSGQVSEKVAVKGDQTITVIDVMQKRPVEVFLFKGKALNPKDDGRLIFVQGAVSNGLMTAAGARSKFAVEADGTAVYNAHGFDDVPNGKVQLLDIAELIESNNG
jgi:hypothetical protein